MKTRVDIGQLWQAVGEAVALPPEGRIRWEATLSPGLTASADEQQLFRVLLNLGRNAVESIGGAGFVRLSGGRSGEGIELVVEDNGSGLPEAAREKLFEPFSCSGRPGARGSASPSPATSSAPMTA